MPSLCKRSNQPAGEVMRRDVVAFCFFSFKFFFVKTEKNITIKGLHKAVPIKQNVEKLSISWLLQRGRDKQRFLKLFIESEKRAYLMSGNGSINVQIKMV